MKVILNKEEQLAVGEINKTARDRAAQKRASAKLGQPVGNLSKEMIDEMLTNNIVANNPTIRKMKEKNPDTVIYTSSTEIAPKVSAMAQAIDGALDVGKAFIKGVGDGAVGAFTAITEANVGVAVTPYGIAIPQASPRSQKDIQQAKGEIRARGIQWSQAINNAIPYSNVTKLSMESQQKEMEKSSGWFGKAMAIVNNPLASTVQVSNSIGQMTPYLAAGGVAAGASRAGLAATTGLGSAAVEYNSSVNQGVIEHLQKQGKQIDIKNIREVTQSPEVMAGILDKATKRAATIGGVSAVGGALAGRFIGGARTAAGKSAAGATEIGIQGVTEGGGEALAQLVSEGRITDQNSIVAGATLGALTNLPEIAMGSRSAATVKAESDIINSAMNSEMAKEDGAFATEAAAEALTELTGTDEKILPTFQLNQNQKQIVAQKFPKLADSIEQGDIIQLSNKDYVELTQDPSMTNLPDLVRHSEDDLSIAEQQQIKDNPFDLQEILSESQRLEAESIKNRVFEGLSNSTFKTETKKGYAELIGAFYEATAHRSGLSMSELDSVLNLSVSSNQQGSGFNQDVFARDADFLQSVLERMGIESYRDRSRGSNSEYVNFSIGEKKYSFRASDHDLPIHHHDPEVTRYEILSENDEGDIIERSNKTKTDEFGFELDNEIINENEGGIEDALNWLANISGKNLDEETQSVLLKRKEKKDAAANSEKAISEINDKISSMWSAYNNDVRSLRDEFSGLRRIAEDYKSFSEVEKIYNRINSENLDISIENKELKIENVSAKNTRKLQEVSGIGLLVKQGESKEAILSRLREFMEEKNLFFSEHKDEVSRSNEILKILKEKEKEINAETRKLNIQKDEIKFGGKVFNQESEGVNGFYDPSQSLININTSADMSTFIHESGHFFLDSYEKLAALDGMDEVKADLETVLKWADWKGTVDDFFKASLDEKRDVHERFARGFEAYIREGKAPTEGLAGVFERFAEYLKILYRSIRDLDVELSDEVRSVMDRMLVADDMVIAYGAKGEGIRQASNWVQKLLDEDIQLEGKHRIEYEAKVKEFHKELSGQPEYQAKIMLEQGVDAELFYSELGFDSAQAVQAAADAMPSIDEAAKNLAKTFIIDKYGNIPNPNRLEEHVVAASYNTKTIEEIAKEANTSFDYRTLTQAAKQSAQARVGKMLVVDLNPNRHVRAEQQLMRKIEKQGATTELVTQRVWQAALVRESARKKIQAEKRIKQMRRLVNSKSKTIDPEFRDQIQAIMSAYSLADQPKKEIRAFAEFVESLEADGIELAVEVSLLRPQPIESLTVNELNALYDTVMQIATAGRNKYRTVRAGKIRDIREIQAKINTDILKNWKKKPQLNRAPTTLMERFKGGLDKFFISHNKVGALFDVMDQGKGGLFDHILRPLQEASSRENTLRHSTTAKLLKALDPVLSDKTSITLSSGMTLSAEQRFSALLNMGNEGNLQRLRDGYRWSETDLLEIAQSFSAEQLEAAQKVWDIYEEFRPDVARIERALTGKEPEWIEAKPLRVMSNDGRDITLRGGYYPAKYDSAANIDSARNEENSNTLQEMKGKSGVKAIRKTFTKSRSEKVSRPILLSTRAITESLSDTVHMVAFAEALHDTKRILTMKNPSGQSVLEVIHAKAGSDYSNAIRTWMDHLAAGVDGTPIDSIYSRIRRGVSMSMLGFSPVTAISQLVGLINTAFNQGAAATVMSVGSMLGSPVDFRKTINAKSEFMRNRGRTMTRDLSEMNRILSTSKAGKFLNAYGRHAYILASFTQGIVDGITWQNGYRAALKAGESEKRAIALADQSVIDYQGDGDLVNLSGIERSGEIGKVFTSMYSYFNTLYNNTYMVKNSSKKGILQKAYTLFGLFFVAAVAEKALRDALQPDNEDDELEERLAKYAIEAPIENVLGMFVGVRELGSSIAASAAGGKPMTYSGPTATAAISNTVKFGTQLGQGEADLQLLQSGISVVGSFTGLPSTQINRTIRGAVALDEGKTDNPSSLVFGFKEQK